MKKKLLTAEGIGTSFSVSVGTTESGTTTPTKPSRDSMRPTALSRSR